MLETLQSLCVTLVGLINIAPVLGMVSTRGMEKAYDVELPSPDLQILMRHRALLFGLVGGFVLYSVFVPIHQPAALALAGISMGGFIASARSVGGHNPALKKVVAADWVGLAFLAGALLLRPGSLEALAG